MPQDAGIQTIKEEKTMRELTKDEWCLVAGGHSPGVCTPATAYNDYAGIRNTSRLGRDLIDGYEGLVEFTSHVIERVALAF